MMGSHLSRALTFCDLRAGSNSGAVNLDGRMEGIRRRHATNSALLNVIIDYEDRFQAIDNEFR